MKTKTTTTWRKVKLGEVVDIIDGDRGENYPNGSDFSKRGYCLFLNAKNVVGSDFNFSVRQFITQEKNEKLRSGRLQRGDFVLTTRGTIGNIAFYGDNIPYEHMRINSGMVILRPKKNVIENKFFYLFLISQEFKEQIAALQSGSAQPQLPIRDLKLFKVGISSMNEQKKISDILWSLKSKIELNNKISKNLEQTAQAIFKEWFANFRFPGYEKTEFVDLELGRIPKGWKVKNIMEIVKRLPVGKKYDNKTALPKGKVPVLDQGQSGYIGFHNDKPGVKANIEEPIVVFTNHTCNYRLLTRDFSCIQNVLPYVGSNGYPTLFVYFLTKGGIKMQEYKGHWPEFEQQSFVVPPTELAEKFRETVQPMIAKMVEAEQENQKLAALRDLLLPKLMSGEIRV